MCTLICISSCTVPGTVTIGSASRSMYLLETRRYEDRARRVVGVLHVRQDDILLGPGGPSVLKRVSGLVRGRVKVRPRGAPCDCLREAHMDSVIVEWF